MGFILSPVINALMPFSCQSPGKPFYSSGYNFPSCVWVAPGGGEEYMWLLLEGITNFLSTTANISDSQVRSHIKVEP